MDEDVLHQLIESQYAIAASNKEIADSINQVAISLLKLVDAYRDSIPERPAPNYLACLEKFKDYSWENIQAEIETVDEFGVATVLWRGRRFKRRSPSNKYGAVIYFSRAIDKENYERLITFQPASEIKVEPVSKTVEQLLSKEHEPRK